MITIDLRIQVGRVVRHTGVRSTGEGLLATRKNICYRVAYFVYSALSSWLSSCMLSSVGPAFTRGRTFFSVRGRLTVVTSPSVPEKYLRWLLVRRMHAVHRYPVSLDVKHTFIFRRCRLLTRSTMEVALFRYFVSERRGSLTPKSSE